MKPSVNKRSAIPFATLAFVCLLAISCGLKKISYASGENLKVIPVSKTDSLTRNLLKPWRDSVDHAMKEVIALSDTAYFPGLPGGNLNNLVADIVKAKADQFLIDSLGYPSHVCLLNRGGFRNTLPKGKITERDLFEMMPFDNYLVFVKLGGAAMDSLLNELVKTGGAAVAGFSMEIMDSAYANAIIAGYKFDSRRDYWIATSDYLVKNGDGFPALKTGMIKVYSGKNLRDIVRDGMKSETNMYGKLLLHNDERITFRKHD